MIIFLFEYDFDLNFSTLLHNFFRNASIFQFNFVTFNQFLANCWWTIAFLICVINDNSSILFPPAILQKVTLNQKKTKKIITFCGI